jgi:SAM-dependent methyltransferase
LRQAFEPVKAGWAEVSRKSSNSYMVPTKSRVSEWGVTGETGSRCLLCSGQLRQLLAGLFDTRFGIDESYGAATCGECGLEQIQPLPSASELKHLYESHYNFGGEKGTLYTNLRERFLSSFLYKLWIHLDGDISFHARHGKGSLLDIGCNEGRGLKIYSRNGFEAQGLELNERAASVAKGDGFTVHTCNLEDFECGTPFDVVVLSNVLEHSLNPKQMLLDARRVLKPGGQVWISCPNNRSWLRKAFGSFWIHWHIPFHISHFSAKTIQNVLSQAGFELVEISQITPALWVSSSVIARLFAKRGRPTRQLRSPILMLVLVFISRLLLFPGLWIGNRCGRGDCLLVVAEKSSRS